MSQICVCASSDIPPATVLAIGEIAVDPWRLHCVREHVSDGRGYEQGAYNQHRTDPHATLPLAEPLLIYSPEKSSRMSSLS